MKKYELVCIIDASVSSADISETKTWVEKQLGDAKLDFDDVGMLPLEYPLRGQDQAYFLSYYVQMENEALNELKAELRLYKKIAKSYFYSMKDSDTFFHFSDLQKRFEELNPSDDVEEEDEDDSEE